MTANDSVAAQVARDHLIQSGDSLVDAIRDFSQTPFEVLYTPFGQVRPAALVTVLQSWQPKPIPADGPRIVVYHGTDRGTAARLMRDGVIPQLKPSNLAMERFERGEYAEFAPGRGVSRGIYVGANPRIAEGFGRVVLALDVPQAWLRVSPEQAALGEKDPLKALRGEDGAVILHAVPPEAITEVKEGNMKLEDVQHLKEGLKLGQDLGITWGPEIRFTPEALYTGALHEKEHTTDLRKAAKIALDHLRERPDYYEKLEQCMPEKRKRNATDLRWDGRRHKVMQVTGPVYHGTTETIAKFLSSPLGPQDPRAPAKMRQWIGPVGFYVTTKLEDARAYAKHHATAKNDTPVVLRWDAADLGLGSVLFSLTDPTETDIDLARDMGLSGVRGPELWGILVFQPKAIPGEKMPEQRTRNAKPTVEQVVRWIQDDGSGQDAIGGFSTATTDEVAEGLGVTPEEAYATLNAAARKGLVEKREIRTWKGRSTSREKGIGWRLWEVKLRPEQIIRRGNKSSAATSAEKRWLVFSNGKEQSQFWPWKGNKHIELPDFEWPRQWDYAGTITEIRYTSDKVMPGENEAGKTVAYQHDFRPAEIEEKHYDFRVEEPFVEVYVPRGTLPFGEPANQREIARRAVRNGKPRFPDEIAFLAKADGWTICPPGHTFPCPRKHLFEARAQNCLLCASPEGDMLVVLDGEDDFSVVMVAVGPTLAVEESGIDD